ncbi:helix-turn-helix transcriptional regulator (plasmid) [Streptomyces sp. SDT5-1]|uniref:helix-turn-helix transcriptional regulator n=1 Tax=Streptomyces sp. SDT5-1 TaxID=3406418 RepID=UPI003FD696B8
MSETKRLVTNAQIAEEFNTSKSRISEWSKEPSSGFPPVHHTEGRTQYREYDAVAAFFAARAKPQRTLPASVLEADQDELLGLRQVAEVLDVKPTTITAYRRDRPGYFPEPDVEDGDGPQWRRGTIVAWTQSRPGKGRRTSKPAAPLPEIDVDGDPDELLGSEYAAAFLGYSSKASFSSALSQGRIPELPEPKVRGGLGGRGGRKQWRRATLIAAARERGTLPSAGDEDLAEAAEAAQMLGYKDTDSFLSAVAHGQLPELTEHDAVGARRGSAGAPRPRRWRRARLEAVAERRRAESSTTED